MTHQGDIPANQDVQLSTEGVPIGGCIPYTGQVLPAGGKWDWADGGLVDRTAFAAFFALTGHAYNGGVDPGSNKVRKPDKRGRVSAGADNFGAGAAGRLPNSPRAIGQSGGEERHVVTSAEMPSHAHSGGLSSTGSTGVTPNSGGFGVYQYLDTGTGSAGGNGAHNNLQPYECDNYIVRLA